MNKEGKYERAGMSESILKLGGIDRGLGEQEKANKAGDAVKLGEFVVLAFMDV